MRLTPALIVSCLLLVAASTPLPLHAADAPSPAADPVEMAITARFGRELEAAAQTPEPEDDAILAGAFIALIDTRPLPQPLVQRLCERAVSLGRMHPVGYPHAAEALRRLEKLDPAHRLDYREQALQLAEQHHETGGDDAPTLERLIDLHMQLAAEAFDAEAGERALDIYQRALALAGKQQSPIIPVIHRRITETRALIKRQSEIAELVGQLNASPNNAAIAARLVSYHLDERDNPAAALPYAAIVNDADLMAHATLAAKPFSEVTLDDCIKLGDWYSRRGEDRANVNRVAMLIRAKTYYEQYLANHTQRDAQRTRILNQLARVDKVLGSLNIGPKLAHRMVRKRRGEEDQREHDPRIAAAIEKGVAWLYTQQQAKFHWDKPEDSGSHKYGGYTALVAYALLMAGEDPRLNNSLVAAIDWVFSQRLNGMYAICFRAHMWEVIPDNERYREIIRQDVSRLQRAMGRDGTFNYDVGNRNDNGDTSTTLAGWLTLWLAHTNGIHVPESVWPRIVDYLLKTQHEDGSWAYRPDPAKQQGTGGMTAAALTCLLMAHEHLSPEQKIAAQKGLDHGLDWMDWHFQPDRNPNGGWKNYYLAAVQHVGLLAQRQRFNNMDWYQSAAEVLLKQQREDGSFGDLQETAFAVIFLSRGAVAFDSLGDQLIADLIPATDATVPADPN